MGLSPPEDSREDTEPQRKEAPGGHWPACVCLGRLRPPRPGSRPPTLCLTEPPSACSPPSPPGHWQVSWAGGRRSQRRVFEADARDTLGEAVAQLSTPPTPLQTSTEAHLWSKLSRC